MEVAHLLVEGIHLVQQLCCVVNAGRKRVASSAFRLKYHNLSSFVRPRSLTSLAVRELALDARRMMSVPMPPAKVVEAKIRAALLTRLIRRKVVSVRLLLPGVWKKLHAQV